MNEWDENELLSPYSQRDYLYDTMSEYENIRCLKEDDSSDRTVEMPTQPFVQCGFEGGGILAHAYNELALQSYEGVIRVYPSLQSAQYCGAFTLKAAGGFMVSGAYSEKGVVPYIIIKSLLGNVCVVEVPFANVNLSDLDGTKIETKEDEYGYMTFATQPGRTYIIWSDDLTREDIPYMNIRMYTNNDWHYYKNARIGSKRQFLTSKRKRGF